MKTLLPITLALLLAACGTSMLSEPGNPQEPNDPAEASAASAPNDGRGDNGGDDAARLLPTLILE